MIYPHVPERHQALLAEWEARLREEPDYYQGCESCGGPISAKGARGPRRLYCSDRCRKAAARGRDDEPRDYWGASVSSVNTLFDHADADGVEFVDAHPGDHPPLNAPVQPREGEPFALEIIGQPDRLPGWDRPIDPLLYWRWEWRGGALACIRTRRFTLIV